MKQKKENLLSLIENKNPETSLIWSMISVAQVKNEEKVMNIIFYDLRVGNYVSPYMTTLMPVEVNM